jgi:hypothetical protein
VQDWRAFARVVVAGRLDEQGRSLADYAPVFDEAVAFNAQVLVILMVLAFAPLPMALFARLRRTVGAQVVFALHLYVFVLVLLCGSLLIAEGQRLLGGGGLASPAVDTTLSIFNLLACGLYIHAALGPAYGSEGVSRIVKAAVLAVATAGIFVGYRFAVFLITLYTT